MVKLKLAVAALLLGGVSAPAFAQVSGNSSASAASVNISVGGVVKANATIDGVSGSAPANYNNSLGVSGVANTYGLISNLVSAYDLVNIGAATSQASSSNTSNLTYTTGTTTLTNAGTTLQTALLGVLPTIGLGITADAITSTTTAGIDANGALFSTGNATITNLSLAGSVLNGLNLNANLLSNPAANTTILSLAGLTLTLNEQLVNSTANSIFAQTNAIHLSLNNYAYDGGFLTGDVILGHSQAAISAIPEPGTWALMILGFGAIGAMIRKRGRHGITGVA